MNKKGIATAKGFNKNVPVAENAEKINNIAIAQDENGVLKVGDIIIPQKRLLWEGEETLDTTPYPIIELPFDGLGKTLEVEYGIYATNSIDFGERRRITFRLNSENASVVTPPNIFSNYYEASENVYVTEYTIEAQLVIKFRTYGGQDKITTQLEFDEEAGMSHVFRGNVSSEITPYFQSVRIYKIYEIIE